MHKAQIYFIVCSRLLWRVVFFNLCTSQHVTWKHIDYWFFISFIQYCVPNHVPIMNMICSIFLKKSFLSKIINKARVGALYEGEEKICSPFKHLIKTMKDIILILVTITTVNCFPVGPWAIPLPQNPHQLDDKLQG